MSVTINLYQMSKKANSTATPAGMSLNPLIALSGEFRQPLDIMHPVVVVEDTAVGGSSVFTRGNPVNYAQIYTGVSDRNRLYWIENLVWISEKLVELHLSEDVLGTWAAEIKGTSQYVLRSASNKNLDIVDTMYAIETRVDQQVDNISTSVPWYQASPSLANGYYVVGIINSESGAYGAVSYYLFPAASFDDLRVKMMTTAAWTHMQYTEIEEALYKSLFNPMQYIVSCKWYPWFPSIPLSFWNYVKIGWWPVYLTSGNKVYPLNTFTYSGSFTINANNHPQLSRGNYLNTPPFRKRTLYIEPFGAIDLDTTLIKNSLDTPEIEYYVDFITGKAKLRVLNYLGTVVTEAEAMLGVDINIAQMTQDIVGAASSAVGAAGSAVTAGLALGMGQPGMAVSGLANTITGIGNAASAFVPHVSSLGSNGSIMGFSVDMLDVTYYTYVADADNTDLGSPLCETKTLSSLSGFTMCHNAHIAFGGCTFSERSAIERQLDTGVFID